MNMKDWIRGSDRIENFGRLDESASTNIIERFDRLELLSYEYQEKSGRARALRHNRGFDDFRERATAIMLDIALIATGDMDVFKEAVERLPELIVKLYSDYHPSITDKNQHAQLSACLEPYIFEMAVLRPDFKVILNTIFDAITEGNYNLQSTSGIDLMYGLLEHSEVDTRAVSLAELKMRNRHDYHKGLQEMAKRLKVKSNDNNTLGKSSIFGS